MRQKRHPAPSHEQHHDCHGTALGCHLHAPSLQQGPRERLGREALQAEVLPRLPRQQQAVEPVRDVAGPREDDLVAAQVGQVHKGEAGRVGQGRPWRRAPEVVALPLVPDRAGHTVEHAIALFVLFDDGERQHPLGRIVDKGDHPRVPHAEAERDELLLVAPGRVPVDPLGGVRSVVHVVRRAQHPLLHRVEEGAGCGAEVRDRDRPRPRRRQRNILDHGGAERPARQQRRPHGVARVERFARSPI